MKWFIIQTILDIRFFFDSIEIFVNDIDSPVYRNKFSKY